MGMVAAGHALSVPGNHENKLVRALAGPQGPGQPRPRGDARASWPASRRGVPRPRCRVLPGPGLHYVLDGGRLVVAHAGLKEAYHGRASGRVRSFALYGDTTGETDEFGLPVRYPWAEDYRGRAMVLYGHTPVTDLEWVNNTLCLDTGCVFGGRLTALRYPERETGVGAGRAGLVRTRPAVPGRTCSAARRGGPRDPRCSTSATCWASGSSRPGSTGGSRSGRRTRPAALEVMSRFAVDPRLAALPAADHGAVRRPRADRPTWSTRRRRSPPTARTGSREVICEEKHMGSRAVVLVCRDGPRPAGAFGAPGACRAPCYTRTGRPFFDAGRSTEQLLAAVRAAVDGAGLWEELEHRLAAAGRRAAALVGQGRRTCCGTSTRRSAPRPGRRCPPRSPRSARPPRRGLDVAELLARSAGPGRRTRTRVHRRLPALLLADRRAGRASGWRPFQVLASRAAPRYRRRGPRLAPGPGRPPGRGRARR